jgi:hypothetical protein
MSFGLRKSFGRIVNSQRTIDDYNGKNSSTLTWTIKRRGNAAIFSFNKNITKEDFRAMVFYGAKQCADGSIDISNMKLPENFIWPHDREQYVVRIEA